MKKVLAVASGGGHWVQLLRLRKAFIGTEVAFMTTNPEYQSEVSEKLYIVKDANLNKKFHLMLMFIQVLWILVRFRPDVIVTTGAAPGFAAIMLGKILGAKTIWLDSIANGEELSASGKRAKKWADQWLTQWEHLATEKGPYFKGKVL